MSSLGSAFSFTPRRVFVLTSSQLGVFNWRRGQVDLPGATFYADEEGLQGFAQYLADAPPLPSYLLVDMVEEEFRFDTVPHVLGPDKKVLLRTRMNRLFRDARYASSMMQGREPDGRRDDRVLFTALIRPELMSPWLGQIAKMKVPLVGIYSVPVISRLLLNKLPTESSDVLVVTLQSAGGLRQTFFSDGHLKMSRLAVAPRLEPSRQAPYVLGEVEKVRRYLNSLRLLDTNKPLDVVLLTGRRLLNDLKRQGRDSLAVRFHPVNVADLGPTLGCKTPLNTPYADALFAHLLAREAPPNYYGRSEDTRYMLTHRVKAAITAASIITLLGSISFSGLQYLQSRVTDSEARSYAEQALFYEERYRIGQQNLPPVPAMAVELKQAVDLASQLRKFKADPLLSMLSLSAGLENFETIQLEQLDWAASTDPDAEIAAGGGVTPRANDFRNPIPIQPPEPDVYYQLVRIRGRIDPFDGDFRQALDTVNRFARAMDRLETVHAVRVTRLPFDASSRRRLSGNAASINANEQATFEMRIALKVNVGKKRDDDGAQVAGTDG